MCNKYLEFNAALVEDIKRCWCRVSFNCGGSVTMTQNRTLLTEDQRKIKSDLWIDDETVFGFVEELNEWEQYDYVSVAFWEEI